MRGHVRVILDFTSHNARNSSPGESFWANILKVNFAEEFNKKKS
jgi:hypothetical protein